LARISWVRSAASSRLAVASYVAPSAAKESSGCGGCDDWCWAKAIAPARKYRQRLRGSERPACASVAGNSKRPASSGQLVVSRHVSGPYDDPDHVLRTLHRAVGPNGFHWV
jgi:hypothetical protein